MRTKQGRRRSEATGGTSSRTGNEATRIDGRHDETAPAAPRRDRERSIDLYEYNNGPENVRKRR